MSLEFIEIFYCPGGNKSIRRIDVLLQKKFCKNFREKSCLKKHAFHASYSGIFFSFCKIMFVSYKKQELLNDNKHLIYALKISF